MKKLLIAFVMLIIVSGVSLANPPVELPETGISIPEAPVGRPAMEYPPGLVEALHNVVNLPAEDRLGIVLELVKDAWNTQAEALEAEGMYSQAADAYAQAFAVDPRDRKLAHKLGATLRQAEAQGSAVEQYPVFANGQAVVFDVPPSNEDGRVLVPIRKIAEALGAVVGWNAERRTVTLSRLGMVVEFKPDTNVAYVNGELMVLDAFTRIKEDRTLVPVRFAAVSLQAHIYWDAEHQMITLIDKDALLEDVMDNIAKRYMAQE